MQYEGNVIRPPSEADSIILQVTVGCSHNRCTFCGAYRNLPFRIKSAQGIETDLAFAARYMRRQRRLFLADGDVLSLSMPRLRRIFRAVHEHLPWIKRIGLYGNAKNIRHKSVKDLQELKTLGLNRVYMGLESGDDRILDQIRKGVTSRQLIEAAGLVKSAGIFLSVTVLLGIGGLALSEDHARATAEVLNAMEPDQIAILTLMLLENTPLYRDWLAGHFVLPESPQLLHELKTMVEGLSVNRGQLHANHASNYLPIAARLPRDKEKILQLIDQALSGHLSLKPEHLRAL